MMQDNKAPNATPPPPFVDVREPHTGKLLFQYDPQRNLVRIQDRRIVTLIDLAQYGVKQKAE